ncbi:glycosyltransferase family protein [Pleurocapsa sp. PCC 7319]|uniref:glycosyltransferase family protein n=1 Tax=Pleurocapsa sp. PCC 7319 TaxID=118161 RepID=UPI00034A259B|nr:glycosyltransferase [Pleurocapsa sp. PCC 7319]
MKKVMFYCQHSLGMGHLVRSIEVARGLIPYFQVCFINGGQIIEEFEFPPEIEVVNIPALKTDTEFDKLQSVDNDLTLEQVKTTRKEILLSVCDRFKPDILIVELFPFGRKRFDFELIPLLQKAKARKTIVVSSVRDILVTKQNQQEHELRVCNLIDQYFDLVLVHGDPNFIKLEQSFSKINTLKCPVYYTGYVSQPVSQNNVLDKEFFPDKPLILVSVGGGRFGHGLLKCVAQTAPLLKESIPHDIKIFTGPFCPLSLFQRLLKETNNQDNISVELYSSNLLNYMQQADLSISMSGYNTTMNILSTGVKAMMMAFQGNKDQEQETRVKKLASLGRVKMIQNQDLEPEKFTQDIIDYLQHKPAQLNLNLDGAKNTASYLSQISSKSLVTV